mmetsp:Transcript_3211/g.13443  ORF Transcript_3211/g.13443 Transcript_3211/m.13443 type:complete len:304 (+) Transcript_3211:34-945(+)
MTTRARFGRGRTLRSLCVNELDFARGFERESFSPRGVMRSGGGRPRCASLTALGRVGPRTFPNDRVDRKLERCSTRQSHGRARSRIGREASDASSVSDVRFRDGGFRLEARRTDLERGDLGEHGVDAGVGRVLVPGGVAGRLGERDHLDHAVLDEHREALRAVGAELVHGPGVGEDHPERLGGLPVGVREELDVGPGDALILGPSVHDLPVVHAEHEHFVDPGSLEGVLPREETRDLARGSGGGEGAGKAHDEGLLAREARGHVHLLGREGALLQGHVGELVANGNHLASFAAYRAEGKSRLA